MEMLKAESNNSHSALSKRRHNRIQACARCRDHGKLVEVLVINRSYVNGVLGSRIMTQSCDMSSPKRDCCHCQAHWEDSKGVGNYSTKGLISTKFVTDPLNSITSRPPAELHIRPV